MRETALELVQRLVAEGRTTEQIRAVLNGNKDVPTWSVPKPAASAKQSPPSTAPAPIPKAQPPTVPPSLIKSQSARRSSSVGWPLIILVTFIPILIVCIDQPIADRFGSLSAILLTLGDVTGIIGLSFYVLALVLSARFHWIEDMFGGLNRVFIAHQILGSLSLLFILVHPFFTAFSYYQYGLNTVSHFFIPQLAYIGSAFGIVAGLVVIFLLVLTLFVKMAYRTWLTTHKFLGVAYLLIILHVIFVPNHITADPVMQAYLYGLLVLGTAAYIYRTLLPNIFVRRYLYTITSAVKMSVGVVEVTMKPVSRAINYKAGQFVYLSFNNDSLTKEWHPFSVTSANTSTDLKVDIRSLGAYTETLTELLPYMVGMTVRIEGAYGRFSFRNFGNVNQVWVAGGIGITPFLSMAQALGPGPYNIDLYYSVNTQSELIDLNVLAQSQSNKPDQVFRVFPFVTEKYNKFLSADIIATTTGDLPKRDFLLCGPPPMMGSLTGQLLKKGVSKNQIHSEEFSL